MPHTDPTIINSSEIALRTALSRLSEASAPIASELQSHLETTITDYTGKRLGTKAALSIDKEAIGLAVTGVMACYKAINEQSAVAKSRHDQFDEEKKEGIAVFSMPTNKRLNRLSREQKVMYLLMGLLKEYPLIQPFLGIKTSIDDNKNIRTDVTFPFFNASYGLPQPIGRVRPLDKERIAIHTFYKSVVPVRIKQIEEASEYSWLYSVWLSSFSRGNFLDHHRLPRFIIISLTNLLWSLQHPINSKTGFPCPVDMCIEMCATSLKFINQMLDENHPIQLSRISNSSNDLLSFIHQIEIHIKALKAAYTTKKSNEINVKDLEVQAHETLEIIDRNVLKLIYAKKEFPVLWPWEDAAPCIETPDDLAATTMAHSIYFLNTSLNMNYSVLIPLFDLADGQEQGEYDFKFMNYPPRTLIDILIVYCHLPGHKRRALILAIKATQLDSAIEFANKLYEFDRQFIKPIKNVLEEKASVNFLSRYFYPPDKEKYKAIAVLTAKHFIPLMTLLVEDFRLDLDIKKDRLTTSVNRERTSGTPDALEQLISSSIQMAEPDLRNPLSGNEQVRKINHHAFIADPAICSYYKSNIAPFLGIPAPFDKIVDELPIYQYSITKMTKLLEKLAEIMEHHRDWLQHKDFQDVLIKSLTKVQSKYDEFKKYVDKSHAMLNEGEHIKRSLNNVLSDMASELKKNIQNVNELMGNLTHIVCAADFNERQKKILDHAILAFETDYADVLDEGVKKNWTPPPFSTPPGSPPFSPRGSEASSTSEYSDSSSSLTPHKDEMDDAKEGEHKKNRLTRFKYTQAFFKAEDANQSVINLPETPRVSMSPKSTSSSKIGEDIDDSSSESDDFWRYFGTLVV